MVVAECLGVLGGGSGRTAAPYLLSVRRRYQLSATHHSVNADKHMADPTSASSHGSPLPKWKISVKMTPQTNSLTRRSAMPIMLAVKNAEMTEA
ncbi:hypothetical protein GCM10023335_56580 [Streptomyces siamensis]|uniref:Uncharacterized protein n=1 Tax=Streptomyces siamensis TaxID=1274986 RepID=A0ABP9J843_9ACTN